ncbi:MAG: metalloregulator ArsR/SmtB family transcription factor [Bacteroidales bacterium]
MEKLIDSRKVKTSLSVIQCLTSPCRLEMIRLLKTYGKMNVTQMTGMVNIQQPVTTKHLTLLHKAGYLKRERKGNKIYYSLVKSRLDMIALVSNMLAV